MRKFIITAAILTGLAPGLAQADAIHDAAKNNDIAGIVAALEAGADVNAYDEAGTPLTYAVKRGHLSAAGLLIQRGASVSAPTEYWGEPLIMATREGRPDLMALLLANRAHPDSTFQGETALHIATWLGCRECVEVLVKAGADVNAVNFGDNKDCLGRRAPLDIARSYGYAEIASYLQAHGAKPVRTQ